jgi:hypothetical protein
VWLLHGTCRRCVCVSTCLSTYLSPYQHLLTYDNTAQHTCRQFHWAPPVLCGIWLQPLPATLAQSTVLAQVRCLLSAVWSLLSGVCCLLSAVWCLLSVVCCLLSVVCCLLSVVCCLLSIVCCLLSVVCCLLSAVRFNHYPQHSHRVLFLHRWACVLMCTCVYNHVCFYVCIYVCIYVCSSDAMIYIIIIIITTNHSTRLAYCSCTGPETFITITILLPSPLSLP